MTSTLPWATIPSSPQRRYPQTSSCAKICDSSVSWARSSQPSTIAQSLGRRLKPRVHSRWTSSPLWILTGPWRISNRLCIPRFGGVRLGLDAMIPGPICYAEGSPTSYMRGIYKSPQHHPYNQSPLTSGSQVPASQTTTISPYIQRALLSINLRHNQPNTTAKPSKTSIPVLVLAVPLKLRYSMRPLCMRANRVPRDGHPARCNRGMVVWRFLQVSLPSHPILVRTCPVYNAVG